MSVYFANDIEQMHHHFGTNKTVSKMTPEVLREFLDFRIACIEEELNETKKAALEKNWSELVDGVTDLLVFSIGLLDAFGIDSTKAWSRVHTANMSKSVGTKSTRPNKFGFPDLIKPSNFKSPDHSDNIGLLAKL